MAGGKTLTTTIQIAGALDTSVKKALQVVADNMDQMEAAVRKAGGAAGELSGKIQDQGKVLEAAKTKYASYVLAGEEGTEQAQKLASEIEELSQDLTQNKAALDAAERAANSLSDKMEDAGDSTDELGDAARETEGGFTVMKGALADLIANGISTFIGKCADAVKSIYGLAESTREYREDMGKLETAWQSAGKSTELATETYKQFYSVLGEEDRSVEAVNHLAMFVNTEKDMQKWTDICTGAWGKFGDSLPIEGLTEAANETVRTGSLTGTLTDAINWAAKSGETFGVTLKANTKANEDWNKAVKDATSAEDFFNLALQQCSTEQERAALITSTLNGLYSDSAEKYRENNESIIESRLATSDYTDTMATLGEKIEPVTTAVTEGLNKLLVKALELAEGIDMDAVIDGVTAAFDGLCTAIDWVVENGDKLMPILVGLASAFAAFEVVNVASKAMGAFSTAISLLSSPITVVVAAIGVLVAAFMHLWNTNDDFRTAITEIWNGIVTELSDFFSEIGQKLADMGITFESISETIKVVWNGLCDFLAPIFEGAFWHVSDILTLATSTILNTLDFFTALFTGDWEGAWSAVKNILSSALDFLKVTFDTFCSTFKAAVDVVLGWFGTTWEETWAAAKKCVEKILKGISSFLSKTWASIKSTAMSALKAIGSFISKTWDSIKNTTSKVWDGVKSGVSNAVNSVKNTVSNVFNSIKSTTATIWNNIKSAIIKPVEDAKKKVEEVIQKIKNAFNFSWSLPKLKLPHISVTGGVAPYGIGGKGSLPKFSIDWYKDGGIMTRPTIFGVSGNRLLAGGEAGAEAVLPLSVLWEKMEAILNRILGSLSGESITNVLVSVDSPDSSNGGYFANAGRLLRTSTSDSGFSLSGNSGGSSFSMGGVTFAPNITVSGRADKDSIVKAIRDEYPEFLDMLEEWFYERGLPAYG